MGRRKLELDGDDAARKKMIYVITKKTEMRLAHLRMVLKPSKGPSEIIEEAVKVLYNQHREEIREYLSKL